MQDALAELLASRLRGLPFLDPERVPGLVRPYEWDSQLKEGVQRERAPVPAKLPDDKCQWGVDLLRPRADRKGIVIMEDGGVIDGPRPGPNYKPRRVATLTLRGWVNQSSVAEPLTDGQLMQAVRTALLVGNGETLGVFGKLQVRVQELPANAALWSQYSAYEGPEWYPPYQLFGLTLTCSYWPILCEVPELTV